MPETDYGVLIARPLESQMGTAGSPHYQIHVADSQGVNYRIAVNVLSQLKPYNLLYHIEDDFNYPLTTELLKLQDGFTKIDKQNAINANLAIDFIRSTIVEPEQMQPQQFTEVATESELNQFLQDRVQQALDDPEALFYAFGQRWGPEVGKPDQYFKFEPGNGIHNIHMNQGNSGKFATENGIWQDGALLIHLTRANKWIAIFLKFQSQSWKTDDTTGNPI